MDEIKVAVDSVWVMLAAILVIMMQAGFALLEAGSTRMKNAGHVAGKTVLSFALCALAFWAAGFAIAFGRGSSLFGAEGWFMNVAPEQVNEVFSSLAYADIPIAIKFLFQFAFAGVSLAIAWGGFAERAKLSVYLVFGLLYSILIYPVIGHWVWGGGWLGQLGMQDFAGSTVVHLQGGVAALVGTVLLGPRIGKYNKDGTPNAIPGHNQVYTVLGVILLWVGWFGFNPGSTLAAIGGFFGYVAMTTHLAAAAGALAALFMAWVALGKPDIPAMLNGVLAALVAITAACAFVEPWAAVVVGAIAGGISVVSTVCFERIGVDDPISAFSVHGVAGIWGTLSTGFFASPRLVELAGVGQAGLFYGAGWRQLGVQLLGLVGAAAYVGIVSLVILGLMKATMGLRVPEEDEIVGLDMSEHGAFGYPEQLSAPGGAKVGAIT